MHLSFLCSSGGAAAAQGMGEVGEAGLGGLPSELREHHPPATLWATCIAAVKPRAFAFIQLSALNINKHRGLAFPSTSTPAATASGKPTSARVPAGTSPCWVQWLVHFLPLFLLLSPCVPSPSASKACPAEQAQGLRGHLLPGPPWGPSWHPASVPQSAKPWTTL